MFKKRKKKINWKAFTRMYRELGEYRIVKDVDSFGIEYFDDGQWIKISKASLYYKYLNSSKPKTIDRCKQLILQIRYDKAKVQNRARNNYKKIKVIYSHP